MIHLYKNTFWFAPLMLERSSQSHTTDRVQLPQISCFCLPSFIKSRPSKLVVFECPVRQGGMKSKSVHANNQGEPACMAQLGHALSTSKALLTKIESIEAIKK